MESAAIRRPFTAERSPALARPGLALVLAVLSVASLAIEQMIVGTIVSGVS